MKMQPTRAMTTGGTGAPRLENARPRRMIGARRVGVHVQAYGSPFGLGRPGSSAQWLQQVRSVLGRLDAVASILQVGPLLRPRLSRHSSPAQGGAIRLEHEKIMLQQGMKL